VNQIEKWESRLKRACKSIDKILAEAKQQHPEACVYVDDTGNVNLMRIPPHNDSNRYSGDKRNNQDEILCSSSSEMDCGAW